MDLVKGGVPYRQPVILFRNHRDRTFEDVTALSGLDKLPGIEGGAAFGDVNNDGKIDVLMLNVGQPQLYSSIARRALVMQHSSNSSAPRGNKAGIGACDGGNPGTSPNLTKCAAALTPSFAKRFAFAFRFRSRNVIDSVEVSWLSGKKDEIKDLPTISSTRHRRRRGRETKGTFYRKTHRDERLEHEGRTAK
jgi:hypothetical protein